jgi:hypothetical protein
VVSLDAGEVEVDNPCVVGAPHVPLTLLYKPNKDKDKVASGCVKIVTQYITFHRR